MGNVALDEVTNYKYLGLYLDNQLNFKLHSNMMIRIRSYISKIRSYNTQYAAIIIFKSMILPIFDIGDVFYIGAPNKMLDRRRVLPNRALRVVCGLRPCDSTLESLKRLKLLTVKQRRELHLMELAGMFY